MSNPEYSTTFEIGGSLFTVSMVRPEEAAVPALLLPFVCWLREQGLLEPLRQVADELLARPMRTRLHSPADKLLTDVLALATGTETNFAVSTLLRPSSALAQALGQPAGLPDHTGMSRFHACLDEGAEETLRLLGQHTLAEQSVLREGEGPLVADLDGTGWLTTTEGARRGYFGARAQGKTGLQWHLATVYPLAEGDVRQREHLAAFLDPGQVPTKCRFYDLFWEVLSVLEGMGLIEGWDEKGRPQGRRPILWRFDEMGQHFICRGHDGRTAPAIMRQVHQLRWHWVSPNQQAAEAGWRTLHNCSCLVRVILLRNYQPKGGIKYSHLLTSLPAQALSLEGVLALAPAAPQDDAPAEGEVDDPGQHLLAAAGLALGTDSYNGRQSIEATNKVDKRTLHQDHQRSRSFVANAALAQLALHVANLLTWFKQELLGATPLAGMGLSRFLREALLLPAQVYKPQSLSPSSSPTATSHAQEHIGLRLLIPSLIADRLSRALGSRARHQSQPDPAPQQALCPSP
jgi:hypothetical protein